MESVDPRRLSVAVRCDALAALGTGHVMRMIALAEELVARGHRVAFFGRADVAWVEPQLARRSLALHDLGEDFAAQTVAWGADAVVIDGYEIPRATGEGARRRGLPVLALVDAGFGTHQDADLYVDQNLGATRPDGLEGRWIGGERYALLRDVVLRRRRPVSASGRSVPRALVVFGGSDPFGGAPVAARLLLDTGLPVEIVAIAASEAVAAQLAALSCGAGQSVTVTAPVDDLPALAVTCDVAVSAAGSSVWELACLGIPTGLIEVVDNQRLGYEAATKELCVGLGSLDELRTVPGRMAASSELAADRLLGDADARLDLARCAQRLIDGDGRGRVADELERLARRCPVLV
ncbi:MAG TPA: spore coat protein [Arachnia sp.]|nr:spore coat protein [Arachnia sp.]HMT85119.1 spore coat protein [Arachnia sp.]